ncbi:MAG: type II toxin-antitoxin system VapC family toxin [Sphingobium sp.]
MILVDSNVLLDLLTSDPKWGAWSISAIESAAADGDLLINEIVYAELAVGFPTIESLHRFVLDTDLKIAPMPKAALYLAAKTHLRYRQLGGTRTNVLPDFFVGAQAAVLDIALLTRDARRFRTYFPTVELFAPDTD